MRKVERIYATVRLSSARKVVREYWERDRQSFDGPQSALDDLLDTSQDAERIELSVELAAQVRGGQRVKAEGSFGIGAPRRGLGAIWHRYRGPPIPEGQDEVEYLQRNYRFGLPDIEDGINQMLGRDPDLHRPPRLSWDNLITALAEHGVHVTEQELIEAPLTVELDAEVTADLEATG
jgi:hypothetical protein